MLFRSGFTSGICVKEREEVVEVRLVGAIGGESGFTIGAICGKVACATMSAIAC